MMIILKDINGIPRQFEPADFYTQLVEQNFKIFGCDLSMILKMKEMCEVFNLQTEDAIDGFIYGGTKES